MFFGALGTALGVSGALWGGAAAWGAGALATTAIAGAGVAGGMMLGGMGNKQKQIGGAQQAQMPNAPKIEDASKKAQLAADERKRAMARSKSVQTNPLGLKEDEANVARKKLLGG